MIKWTFMITGLIVLLTYAEADYISDLEYDAEIEDDEFIDPTLQQEMDAAFDSEDDLQRELDQLLSSSMYNKEINLEDKLDEFDIVESNAKSYQNHVRDSQYSFKSGETQHERKGQLDDVIERIFILLQGNKIGPHNTFLKKSHNDNQKANRCSKFARSANTNHRCKVIKTFLGSIISCRSRCKLGYRYNKVTPLYELCGKATEYRWTYELRGLKRAVEKCILERTGNIMKRDVSQKNVSNETQHVVRTKSSLTAAIKKLTKSIGTSTAGLRNAKRPSLLANTTHHISRKPSVCDTSECTASAAYYMNKIDFTVKPCDNFFDYACGRWLEETTIPKYDNKFQTYTIIRNRVDANIAKLLAKPIKKSEGNAVAKTKLCYRSCINMMVIDELDSQPLLNFLTGDLTWPLLTDDWNPDDFDFETTLGILRGKYNNQVMTQVKVHASDGKHILQMWKGKMAIPFSYFFEDRHQEKLEAYYDLMYDIAMMLGADPSTAYNDILDLRIFEKEIARHKLLDFDILNLMTIDDMLAQIQGIDWLKLFRTMIDTYPMNGSTLLEVWNKEYLNNIIQLMKRTDKRTIQNYMVWRIVKHRIQNLSDRFQKRYLQYINVLTGKTALPSRINKCSRILNFEMVSPVSYLFIDKYFSKSKKAAALELFHFTRKGFIHLLDTEVDWMDDKTKAYAKKKALAVTPHIGYNADLYKNLTRIDEEYKDLKVDVHDYFGNTLRTLTMISQNKFKLLGETYNKSIIPFTARPTMVNAFYNPTRNTITLPAGEMQYPFYWGHDFPRSFQFGGIGTILGHELTHGFDNKGRFYDLNGKKKNWWTEASAKQFNDRAQCMKRQYSSYYITSAKERMNGEKTLSENIADNGGIRETYAGYKFWLKAHNMTGEELEPSTGLTNDQMFFVGFANIRCAKFTRKGALYEVGNDMHSVGRYRVIGSLQNFDEFSKAFKCPSGSYMNPKNKCIIW